MGINVNLNRADEAGRLIWDSDPNKNWWGNRMDDVRGIIQGAANPFITGLQGLGVGAATDSVVTPVTDASAQSTLQGIHALGKLSTEAQLEAATTLQDSAFAVKDSINSAKQWADAHPNITATAQTALSGAEAAGTVWVGKKVEVNPTKWDWVRNTSYETPTARPMQTLDGEMAGGNRPIKPSTSSQPNFSTYPYTDSMADKKFTQLVDSVRVNGFTNPNIKYVDINGEAYIVHGNNRVRAAKYLNRENELKYHKVELPVEGTNFKTEHDVLEAASQNTKPPRYRDNKGKK